MSYRFIDGKYLEEFGEAITQPSLISVCRPEQYRVKSILYRSLHHYTTQLEDAVRPCQPRAITPVPKQASSPVNIPLVEYGSSDEEDERSITPIPWASASSTSPSESEISGNVLRLSSLLQLFDEVLCEEFVEEHASFPNISAGRWAISVQGGSRFRLRPPSPSRSGKSEETQPEPLCNIACDFCGGDLFQSFFECQTCLPKETDLTAGHGDGLLICAACYVEGRSCLCGDMYPVQIRPFETLLRERNRAAIVLDKHAPGRTQRPISITTGSALP